MYKVLNVIAPPPRFKILRLSRHLVHKRFSYKADLSVCYETMYAYAYIYIYTYLFSATRSFYASHFLIKNYIS